MSRSEFQCRVLLSYDENALVHSYTFNVPDGLFNFMFIKNILGSLIIEMYFYSLYIKQ